jgi:hypothetical protein
MSLRGLALLFGISTRALPSWVSKTRWNNLKNGLAVRRTVGPSRLTDSSHPSSREGHLSTARWSSRFLLSSLDGPHGHCELSSPTELGAVNPYAVQQMAPRRGPAWPHIALGDSACAFLQKPAASHDNSPAASAESARGICEAAECIPRGSDHGDRGGRSRARRTPLADCEKPVLFQVGKKGILAEKGVDPHG